MQASQRITIKSLTAQCRLLSRNHPELAVIYHSYGAPPLWSRPQGFATLIQIILEQQVSLASAKVCFDRLIKRLGRVTPELLLELNDSELKLIGFSRQKAAYARHLAEAATEQRINFDLLNTLPDDEVRFELIKLKGIGRWTADIYLLMAMLRPDVMPKGDLALHSAFQKLTNAATRLGADEFNKIAEKWSPHRSAAARLLWHYYLSEKR